MCGTYSICVVHVTLSRASMSYLLQAERVKQLPLFPIGSLPISLQCIRYFQNDAQLSGLTPFGSPANFN